MKKIFALLLVLCLLISLVACRKAPVNEPDNGTQESSSSSSDDTDLPVMQRPLVAVSIPVITESETADDGTVIFNYLYQNMKLTLSDADVARAVIVDFLTRIDATKPTADNIKAAAKDAYNGGTWTPYLCQITYNPMRIDSSVLSLLGTYATYEGGARAEANYISVNYDLATGTAVSLSNVLSAGASSEAITGLVISALDAQKEEKYLYEDFADNVKTRFADHIGDDQGWYFSPNGLCFYFSPREIAPNASGVVVAEIPYSKLLGIIKDAYLPAERDAAKGIVKMQNFDPTAFTQIAELILDESAPQMMLYTDKAVYDIKIEAGDMIGTKFSSKYAVFAASSLTPGDAIVLQAGLDHAPALKLTYQTDNGSVSAIIKKDGLK